jgi:hypothetical protein
MSSYAFYLLGYYNRFSSFCTNAKRTIRKIYDAVCVAVSPSYYIFFNGVEHPCTNIDLHAPGSAQPLWLYSPEINTFYEWPMHETDAVVFKQLPILSLEILDGEDILHDLSDFVASIQVHVRGEDEFYPSLSHIVNAWSLNSKIILDPRLKGRMIDTEANILEVELNSPTLIRKEIDNTD